MTAALILAATVFAQDVGRPPVIIGIVEVPGLFGTRDADGPPGLTPPAREAPIPIHVAPASTSRVLARLTSPEAVAAREHDYEAPGALAYDVRDGWYLVRVSVEDAWEPGWLPPAHAGELHRLDRLLLDGLAYLTESWDGGLYAGAGGASAVTRIEPAGPRDIVVTATRDTGDALWLQIEVLAPGRCEGADAPPVVARGWVSAHGADGRPNAWFRSRGC